MATADPVSAIGARMALWGALTPMLLVELLVPFLLGVWAARCGLLDEPHRHVAALRTAAVVGIGLAVVGGLPLALLDAQVWTGAPATVTVTVYTLHGLTSIAGGLGYAALVGVAANRAGAAPGPVVTALAACGQRSLTCYLLQSVVFVAVFVPYAGGLGTRLGTAAASGIAVFAWIGTVVFADALRRKGNAGPAEWLLRRLTYGPAAPRRS